MKYRKLTELETELLINQGCRCDDWQAIGVTDDFSPDYVFDVHFIGEVRMAGFTGEVELDGGVRRHTGICHATIDTCTIGRDAYIDGIRRFLSHYDIGEGAVISDVGALYATVPGASAGRGACIIQCGTLCNLQIAEGVCLRNVSGLSDLSIAPFKAVEALSDPRAGSSQDSMAVEAPARAGGDAMSGLLPEGVPEEITEETPETPEVPEGTPVETREVTLEEHREDTPVVYAGPDPAAADASDGPAEAQPVREEWDFMEEPDDDLAAGDTMDDGPSEPAGASSAGGFPGVETSEPAEEVQDVALSDDGELDTKPSGLDELYAGLPQTPRQTSLFDEWEEPVPTPILADTLQPGYSPVNDKFTPQADLTQTLQSKNLAHLSDGIGLNDRFLFTRELFKSNPQLYKECVEHVDACASRAEAVAYVQNTYDWKKASSAARKFMALISRRFPEK
ncbi:MAG: DUF4954 family protein [Bacteroidales bacterium]|nr:DUF4954 family protein [Bacteroidales bacterium]